MPSASGICISLLGGFCCYAGPKEVSQSAFQGRKALSLFKLLAIIDRHQLHRDQALETFWPGMDPLAASAQLYKAIHYIRKAFETTGIPFPTHEILSFRNEFLRLQAPEGVHTDVEAFQKLAKEAMRLDTLPAYRRALACYGGDLLPADLYERWTEELRESLRFTLKRIYIRIARKMEQAGELEDTLESYQRALELDPLDETTHRRLMRLFARSGQRTRALFQFRRCRSILKEQLDVDPESETMRLAAAIQNGKIAADVVPLPTSRTRKAASESWPLVTPSIGREFELRQIDSLFADLENGQGNVLLLTGTAGVGKTHLALTVTRKAQRKGWAVFFGRTYEGDKGLPYAPILDALRIAVDQFPEQCALLPRVLLHGIAEAQTGAEPPETPLGRSALFAALLRFFQAVTRSTPALLIVDDFHLADEATQKLFAYLGRNCRSLPLLLIATIRQGDFADSPAIAAMRKNLHRSGIGITQELEPLSLAQHARLLQQILGPGELPDEINQRLFEQSMGNPLFAIEITNHLRAGNLLALSGTTWQLEPSTKAYIPPSLTNLLEEKWNRLPAGARAVLNLAAVAGEHCEVTMLESILSQSEAELLDNIDACFASRLLIETGSGYRFSHPLFREAVFQQMSQTRRGHYHFDIANFLSGAAADAPELLVEAIAFHYREAGKAALARPYFLQAGERVAAMLTLPHPLLLVGLTTLVALLAAGFAGATGFYLRQIIAPPRA